MESSVISTESISLLTCSIIDENKRLRGKNDKLFTEHRELESLIAKKETELKQATVKFFKQEYEMQNLLDAVSRLKEEAKELRRCSKEKANADLKAELDQIKKENYQQKKMLEQQQEIIFALTKGDAKAKLEKLHVLDSQSFQEPFQGYKNEFQEFIHTFCGMQQTQVNLLIKFLGKDNKHPVDQPESLSSNFDFKTDDESRGEELQETEMDKNALMQRIVAQLNLATTEAYVGGSEAEENTKSDDPASLPASVSESSTSVATRVDLEKTEEEQANVDVNSTDIHEIFQVAGFPCCVCNKPFKSKKSLRKHRIHANCRRSTDQDAF